MVQSINVLDKWKLSHTVQCKDLMVKTCLYWCFCLVILYIALYIYTASTSLLLFRCCCFFALTLLLFPTGFTILCKCPVVFWWRFRSLDKETLFIQRCWRMFNGLFINVGLTAVIHTQKYFLVTWPDHCSFYGSGWHQRCRGPQTKACADRKSVV